MSGQDGSVCFAHGPFAKLGREEKGSLVMIAVCKSDPEVIVLIKEF